MGYPSNKPQLASIKVDDLLLLKNGATVQVYIVANQIEARLVSGTVTDNYGKVMRPGFPMGWFLNGTKMLPEKYLEGRNLDILRRVTT
jgi:hypothetical protein